MEGRHSKHLRKQVFIDMEMYVAKSIEFTLFRENMNNLIGIHNFNTTLHNLSTICNLNKDIFEQFHTFLILVVNCNQ